MNGESRLQLILYIIVAAQCYSIPNPKVEILSPHGLRVSIPHEEEIVLVGYHLNINKPIALLQAGDYSADLNQPVNGHWIYDNTQVFVDPGDKVSYWIHVQYGQWAYRKHGSVVIASGNANTSHPAPCNESPSAKCNPPGICEKSATTVGRRSVCKGQLIFEDNFDSLNWTMWRQEVRIPIDIDDSAFVSFQNRPENCYVSNGQLHIVPNLLTEVPGFDESTIKSGILDLGSECTATIALPQECKRRAQFSQILPPVVSARIRTKDFFSFRFGKVEVRAKLPKGDWLFPLILLEPLENYYGYTGYASGQMRVAFNRGNEILDDSDGDDISGSRVSGGVVLSSGDTFRDIWLKSSLRRSHLGNEFHIYTLLWTEEYISLWIDGNEYATIRGGFSRLHHTQKLENAARWENGNFMAPFDREFYIALGVSAGGHSDFPNGCVTGQERLRKPWLNRHPKGELRFWNDRANWIKSWNGDNVGLHVDYVRVFAL